MTHEIAQNPRNLQDFGDLKTNKNKILGFSTTRNPEEVQLL